MVPLLITTSVLIVGGGVSGLVTAHRLVAGGPELDVVVIEGASRPGGVIGTDHVDGFAFEWGPNAFLNNVPETLDLARELNLTPRLIAAAESAKKRYLFVKHPRHGGRLCALPRSPIGLFSSPVLSFKGALRLLSEPFRPRGSGDDESVGDFGRRRVGAEATAMLLDPLVTGVFGGDVERLSIQAALPRVASLEREHGSLLKGMLALARQRRRERREAGTDRVKRTLYSFREGMEELPAALQRRLGDRMRLDTDVLAVRPMDDGFEVPLRGGEDVRADAVVVATPAPSAARLLGEALPEVAAKLEEIPHAPMAVVCLGYRRADVEHPLDGFGFLAPRKEGLRILGAVWVSSVYPEHAPRDAVSLRIMLGGAHDPAVVGKSDEELVSLAVEELSPLLGLRAKPVVHRIYRHARGLPQYNVGHTKRLEAIDELVRRVPGLFLTGNAYRGVAVNDCVANGERLATRVRAFLEERA